MINESVVYIFVDREFMFGGNKQECIDELQCYELNRVTPLKE